IELRHLSVCDRCAGSAEELLHLPPVVERIVDRITTGEQCLQPRGDQVLLNIAVRDLPIPYNGAALLVGRRKVVIRRPATTCCRVDGERQAHSGQEWEIWIADH